MNRLTSYFQTVGIRRILGMLIGNILVGVGCGFFKWATVGNDPYSAGSMALAALLGMQLGVFNMLYNIMFFLAEIRWGRRYIGIGTIVNWFGLGFFTQWTFSLLSLMGTPVTWPQKILAMAVGIVIICFGLSLYQTSDTGLAPYDSLSVMMSQYWHIPYFWCRMITDCISVAICYFAGGLLGVGTLVCAFGLGPIIHLCNRHVSEPLLGHRIGEQAS